MGLAPEAAAASQFEVEQMVKADVAAESPPKRAPTPKRPESAPPLAARKIGGGFPAERSRAFPNIVVPDLAAAHERKHELVEQCTNMKKELFRRQTAYGMSSAEYRKRQEILSYRHKLNDLLGGGVAEELGLDVVDPASGEEVVAMSRLINRTLAKVFADPQKRSWYNLFLHMDSDKTGMIQYEELLHLIRQDMGITPKQVPDGLILSVWKSVDSNASGNITAGEFGSFMRLAPHMPAETWKVRLHKSKVAEKKAVDDELKRQLRGGMTETPPATLEEVTHISELLNRRLPLIFVNPLARQWFRLFKHIDKDLAGRVYYKRFRDFIRYEMDIKPSMMSEEKLDACWCAVDTKLQGFLTAAEFGPFMQLGERSLKKKGVARGKAYEKSGIERHREANAHLHSRLADDYLLSASKAHLVISDEYRALEQEAADLKRALRSTSKAETALKKLWDDVPKTPQRPASSHTRLQQSAAHKETKSGAAGYVDMKAALLGGSASAPPAPTAASAAGDLPPDALHRERVASTPKKKRAAAAQGSSTQVVSLEELFKGSPKALAASPGLKTRSIHSASAPTLKNAGAKLPKGRGDSAGMGPMQSGKAWGSCNFDKLYMTGKL